MVPCLAFCTAVVARDDGPGILVLVGHGLGGDGDVKVTKLDLHVDAALVADRTSVRSFPVRAETVFMDGMATFHDRNRSRRVKQVIAADGTVAVG